VRVAIEAATALEHAHERGVLHRDVKPSNVLLTPAGRVVLVDFGLAALTGKERMTRSGSQLGSLPYKAPEQLAGEAERIGPATDVYGLGATLYELLAQRPPHEGESVAALIGAVASGPPRDLRRRQPRLSRDLETCVLTALDPDPASRYADPGAFAADLQRALEGRPVLARRVGALGRLRRWARRHPGAAVAAGLGSPGSAGRARPARPSPWSSPTRSTPWPATCDSAARPSSPLSSSRTRPACAKSSATTRSTGSSCARTS
jgi:hypothetical protein